MDKVYVVAGPTGVGKTAFSIELAKALDGEIINGDAYQIYKGLNIGTAKITVEEMSGIPHHLFDILDPTETFSVADYQQIAREKIAEVIARNKVPIIVGGSGYYLKTILYDYVFNEQQTETYDHLSNVELYEELLKRDQSRALTLHPNNRIRVLRALQSVDTIKPIGGLLYDAHIIAITMDREELYKRINNRVDIMLANGLVEEIEELLSNGLNFDMQSMKAIGYKEFQPYFNNEQSLEDVVELVKRNSRRYAKKQYTWFRNQMEVEWLNKDEIVEYIDNLQN